MSFSINDTRDLLIRIFSDLNIKDLVKIAGVCKKWSEISSEDLVWNSIQFFEKYPTPSPIKEYTISIIINEALPFIKKMEEVSNWPDYNTGCVDQSCKDKTRWTRALQLRTCNFRYLASDFTTFDLSEKKIWGTKIKVIELFSLVAGAFEMYICCARIGFKSLNEAEALALKTRNTFHNPYPFLILEQEYKKLGNNLKEAEMQQIAQEYT